jgi:5-methylcytosine-specific restriction endonuclease McrA
MARRGYVARQMARLILRDEPDGVWRCYYCRIEVDKADEFPPFIDVRGDPFGFNEPAALDWTCSEQSDKPYPERDHVVPRSRGGSNDLSNLVLACQGCNVRKGARLLSELPAGWAEWRNAARV